MNKLSSWCATIVIIGLFLLSPLLSFGRQSVYAAVLINEIFPKTTDPAQSWIELYNTDANQVSLNLWKLKNSADNTFIINASGIIAGHGFLTFYQSQSGINLSINGDTVRLFDNNNTQVDSQSYPATLGYYTSVGRSPDGGAGMTVCTAATPNAANTCPLPTATPSPTPSPIPTPTPIPPTSTPIPAAPVVSTDTPAASGFEILLTPTPMTMEARVLGATNKSITPTPTPSDAAINIVIPNTITISRTTFFQILIILTLWIFLMLIARITQNHSRRKNRRQSPPPLPPAV